MEGVLGVWAGSWDQWAARRRQGVEGGRQEGVLLRAQGAGRVPAARQQVHDDLGLIEVVRAGGQSARIQQPVVTENIAVQEVNRDALVQAVAVELALAGAGEAGVDEHDQVLAGDLVPARLFKVLFFKVLFFEVLFFKVLFFEVLFGVHARQIGEEGRTQTRANTDKKGEYGQEGRIRTRRANTRFAPTDAIGVEARFVASSCPAVSRQQRGLLGEWRHDCIHSVISGFGSRARVPRAAWRLVYPRRPPARV